MMMRGIRKIMRTCNEHPVESLLGTSEHHSDQESVSYKHILVFLDYQPFDNVASLDIVGSMHVHGIDIILDPGPSRENPLTSM